MKPSIPPFQGRFTAFLCPRIYPRIYEKGGVTPPLRFFIRGDSRKSAAAYRSALGAASTPVYSGRLFDLALSSIFLS
jgi:hypothetical protein